ncbi:Cytochrome P450 monooxygenase BOA4 [Metarhizium brunneum]|uniref:Cytochrome P450 monooxygenase BOA4 n=1 Tax=Metarhizium brunneum TaxID=500148 RepID=A0A7D5USV1_9HYPO|nr:Cytochrome P450 monooxygenase BOA4 [Metarhizium brunneum]
MVSFWVLNHLSRGLLLYGLCLMLALTLSALLNGLFSHKRNELKARSSRFILIEPFYILKSRLVAWSFLIPGPSIIQTTYEKSNGAPFSVDTPNNTIVLVSDWKHIKEINAAPEGTLSLLGAAKDVLQPKHTMTNFDWTNKRGSDGAPLQMALRAGIKMIEHTLIIAEILRMVPGIVSDPLGKFLSSRLDSGSVMTNALVAVVSERFRDAELRKLRRDIPEKNDCIQWIMDHAPPTQALGPEYVDILREEIEQTGWEAFDKAGGQILPLMDSFLKESARLNPIESVSTRRKVLKPFHFSDGTSVQPGQWVCSAPRAMNRNPETWAKADEFYGFRFVKPEVLDAAQKSISSFGTVLPLAKSTESFTIPEAGKASEYTNLSDWQQWGTGKASCTGRWYAAAAIKTMIGLFITKYDFQLVDPKAKRYFSWRTFIYPYEGTPIALTPRMVLDRDLGQ